MKTRTDTTRLRMVMATMAVLGLLAAACGGDEAAEESAPTTTAAAATTQAPATTEPAAAPVAPVTQGPGGEAATPSGEIVLTADEIAEYYIANYHDQEVAYLASVAEQSNGQGG